MPRVKGQSSKRGKEREHEEKVSTEERVAGESGNSSTKNLGCEQYFELQASECKALFEKMRDKIVIICTRRKNANAVCTFTGFYVSEGCILTSGIFLQTEDTIFVFGHDYDKEVDEGVQPVHFEVVDDWLGILRMEAKDNSYVRIGHDTTVPAVGRSLYSIAHPMFNYFSFMCGNVVSPLKTMDQTSLKSHTCLQVMQLRGLSGGANSVEDKDCVGAPVFDSNGNVIGMIIDSYKGFQYAVPTFVLNDFRNRF